MLYCFRLNVPASFSNKHSIGNVQSAYDSLDSHCMRAKHTTGNRQYMDHKYIQSDIDLIGTKTNCCDVLIWKCNTFSWQRRTEAAAAAITIAANGDLTVNKQKNTHKMIKAINSPYGINDEILLWHNTQNIYCM